MKKRYSVAQMMKNKIKTKTKKPYLRIVKTNSEKILHFFNLQTILKNTLSSFNYCQYIYINNEKVTYRIYI